MGYGSVLAGILALGLVVGQGDKPKDLKEVMALHKGKDSFLNKITSGKGTDDDHKKLLAAYEIMAGLKPPQGEEKSWKEKTDGLVSVAKDVVAKKEGALDKLKKASDCKACHSIHKPK